MGGSVVQAIRNAPEAGTHGGADRHLFADLFGESRSGRLARLEDVVKAVLIGAAVNVSLSEGRRVDVQAQL